jgi:hypothetical protein
MSKMIKVVNLWPFLFPLGLWCMKPNGDGAWLFFVLILFIWSLYVYILIPGGSQHDKSN